MYFHSNHKVIVFKLNILNVFVFRLNKISLKKLHYSPSGGKIFDFCQYCIMAYSLINFCQSNIFIGTNHVYSCAIIFKIYFIKIITNLKLYVSFSIFNCFVVQTICISKQNAVQGKTKRQKVSMQMYAHLYIKNALLWLFFHANRKRQTSSVEPNTIYFNISQLCIIYKSIYGCTMHILYAIMHMHILCR